MKKKSNQIAPTKHISKDDVLALLSGGSLTSIEICQHFATVSPLEIQNHLSALEGLIIRSELGVFTSVSNIDTKPNNVSNIDTILSKILVPFTASEIATKTGLIRNNANGLKSGKRAVSMEKAIIICAKLGLTRKFLDLFEIEVAKLHLSITGEVLK